ncbi:MAG: ATP-binding protein [Candidatus Izemoplasmataceae bacterium]
MRQLMNKLTKLYARLSLSSQIIMTIILVFITFFILQLFLNSVFFRNFYIQREIQTFEEDFNIYVDELKNHNTTEHYDIVYDFTKNYNAYSVILDQNFRVTNYQYSEYSITVQTIDGLTDYQLLILDNEHTYSIGNYVEATVVASSSSNYTIRSLELNNTSLYDQSCLVDCIEIQGFITEVNKPYNLNFLYEQNFIVQTELGKISNNEISLSDYVYDDGFRYQSDDGPVNSLIFIKPINDWTYVMTIIQVQDTSSIISIVSSYQNYVYLTAIVIIILWSLRIGNTASNPIKNIEKTARQIANLNFEVSTHEYKSKETTSLSNSINLIAKNLKQTIETINNKNNELIALYKQQTEQTKLKKQLVSSISHELKTPLMIMQVTIQAILDNIIPEENYSDELKNVLNEINKSSMMLQDLLEIYRLEDHEIPLDLEEFNLSHLVEFFVNDFSNIMKKYQFNLKKDLDTTVKITADKKLIKRVISNFFTNAIKNTPDSEMISVRVYKDSTHAYFEIINMGTTIDANHLEHIWMPFYTINPSNPLLEKSKGTGIGLYLVSEVLKAHQFEYSIQNIQNGVKASFKAPLTK